MSQKTIEESPAEHATIFFEYEVTSGPFAGASARRLRWSQDGTVGWFEIRKGKEIIGPEPILREEVRFRGARGK